jgi:hypothetical protein
LFTRKPRLTSFVTDVMAFVTRVPRDVNIVNKTHDSCRRCKKKCNFKYLRPLFGLHLFAGSTFTKGKMPSLP